MLTDRDEALYAAIGRNVNRLMAREEISGRMMVEWTGLNAKTIAGIRRSRTGMGYSLHNLAKIADLLRVGVADLMEGYEHVGNDE